MTWLAIEILAINLAMIATGLAAGRAGISYTDRMRRAEAPVKVYVTPRASS